MGTPLAYIRRSRVSTDKPGAVSHEAQTTAVRALAARHGYTLTDAQILEDWGKSGGAGKEHGRTRYLELRAAIAADRVSDLFAYDQSRLTRSTLEWATLATSCREHHVKVHLVNGGTKDFDSADGRMTADILASIAAAERERAQERSVETVAKRRQRGDSAAGAWTPPYGIPYRKRDGTVIGAQDDPEAIVAAFRETGSYEGAARILNERGMATKRGGKSVWHAKTVRAVIVREAPRLVPKNPRPGARSLARATFAGLIRCAEPCGGLLTPSTGGRDKRQRYICHRAHITGGEHPRPYSIQESRILPWAKAEIAHLTLPEEVTAGGDASAERADLTAQRERLALAFARGGLPVETYTAEDAALVDRLAALAVSEEVMAIPPIDWDWDPSSLTGVLRAILREIRLGPDMRPVDAIWRNPKMRGAEPIALLDTADRESLILVR